MNEAVRRAREVALGILQPSERDLAHGLELHANSLVVDAYGFSPSSAVDGEAVKEAVEAGASDSELQDLLEDMRMTRCVTDAREREEFVGAWEAAGVNCIVQNSGEEGQAVDRLLKRLARFTYLTDMMPEVVSKAVRPADILAAGTAGKRCLYFTGNGVPLAQSWESAESELRYIRTFFELGIRMMHVTYNRRNMLGDGCAEPANGGLSDLGRRAIAEMNRVGVIVDVAHSGWQTSLEAARASTRPMVASHSGCCAVNVHARFKPDEVIRAIVDTGGYLGICCVPAFLGRSGDINALLDHIDYVVKTFGTGHVAIGTDTAYTSSFAGAENAKIPARRRQRSRFENFWPPKDPLFSPEWQKPHMSQSLAWTNWPLFTVGMVQRGYSDEDIQKILGGNVVRVAEEVLSSGAYAPLPTGKGSA